MEALNITSACPYGSEGKIAVSAFIKRAILLGQAYTAIGSFAPVRGFGVRAGRSNFMLALRKGLVSVKN